MSWWSRVRRKPQDPREVIRGKLDAFRDLLQKNNQVLELIAGAEEKLGGEYIFDRQYLISLAEELEEAVRDTVLDLNAIADDRYRELHAAFERARVMVNAVLERRLIVPAGEILIPLEKLVEEDWELAGEKLARLASLVRQLSCPAPAGFVVTTYACQRFLNQAGIEREVEWLGDNPSPEALDKQSPILMQMIRDARIPKDIARALRKQAKSLQRATGGLLAVRSSAIGEDSEDSFAGQYRTLLGVPAEEVPAAWREVVASIYSREVMRYRLTRGLHPTRGLMAVGVMEMVAARTAGVAYSLDPVHPEKHRIVISAAWGLGKTVVEGLGATDRFELVREIPHRVTERSVGHKEQQYTLAPAGGVQQIEVPPGDQKQPCLTTQQLKQLSELVLRVEGQTRGAQDIEWAFDEQGRLFLLQARPLALASPATRRELPETLDQYPVLMRESGVVACRGIGAGPVFLVLDPSTMTEPPADAVLVARSSTPRLSALVARAAAVITDVGTPTGHLATIAREHGVPTIVDAGRATELLPNGEVVTVDAEENIVYRGRVQELLRHQLMQGTRFEDTQEYRLLRGLLYRTAPLHLKDPNSSSFSPQSCTTYHDIIRFAHEKAVAYFAEGLHNQMPSSSQVRRLALDIPLDLVLVDVGQGFITRSSKGPVEVEDIRSAPLQPLLEGLTAEGVWATEPTAMDLGGFMSSATRGTALSQMQVEQNVAILSEDYLNLSLHLGYHFNVVDCYLGEVRNDNYIYFRFAGGATEMARRSRRVALLRIVLEANDFVVESAGDLIYGRLKKIPRDVMEARLRMIGRLIGFTRQLDVLLKGDELVAHYAHVFLGQRDEPADLQTKED